MKFSNRIREKDGRKKEEKERKFEIDINLRVEFYEQGV